MALFPQTMVLTSPQFRGVVRKDNIDHPHYTTVGVVVVVGLSTYTLLRYLVILAVEFNTDEVTVEVLTGDTNG